jgi:hypothetical protein
MSIYIRRRLKTVASVNQNLSAPLISRGESETEERIEAQTALAEVSSSQIVVASGASDQSLPLGSGITTGRLLIIESDVDITFKLSGAGNTALSLKVPTSGGTARLTADLEFTSIHVSVPGAADANIFYGVIGA